MRHKVSFCLRFCFSIFIVLGLISCSTEVKKLTWRQAMNLQMQRYGKESTDFFKQAFRQRNLHYPPKAMTLVILKQSRKMELYARQDNAWQYVLTFPVYGASGVSGPKLKEGDKQVPEGFYHVTGLNPQSRFHLSMRLNYPNTFDQQQAQLSGRTDLGGDIFIHGTTRSVGCIAIGNSAIEKLFPLVYRVGIKQVQVLIAPDDLRIKAPIFSAAMPTWLPGLYLRLLQALEAFPEPKAYVALKS
jgi:murein L,D-transpeptidase YafK